MWTNLIKGFLLFSVIPALEGSRKLMEVNKFLPVERTVKKILESCYENDTSSNPILIFGDFNENIEKSSIIRLNDSTEINDDTIYDFKARAIIVMTDSVEKLQSDLKILWPTEWWDHMTPFFIIVNHTEGCENFKEILNATWSEDMISSIYICAESMTTSVLFTLNLMADYAPYPWRRVHEIDDLNVFRQVFDSRTSCKNLNFDKTRVIHGYEIRGMVKHAHSTDSRRKQWGTERLQNPFTNMLRLIITKFNASGGFEVLSSRKIISNSLKSGTSDIKLSGSGMTNLTNFPFFLFPFAHNRLLIVVKLGSEVTTLQKILKLWSPPVLMAAVIALAFLTLILTIKNHNFVVAMLDIVRLLTYTSIRTNSQNHSFRIYFTTMLIFMIISNAVFQGKIASFLTKRERGTVKGTLDELANLGYKMFVVGDYAQTFNQLCPNCHFKGALASECIDYVLNRTDHLCVVWESRYHADYSQLELQYIHRSSVHLYAAMHRQHWPFKNRLNREILRVVQTGIVDFLQNKRLFMPKQKRAVREAEWSSAQYRPVKLYKLTFAFQLLALGLLLSIIVFILELHEVHHGTT